MDYSIITTLVKYKESYNKILENHLKEYEDYDELHFVEYQIKHYQECYATANVQSRKVEAGIDPKFPNKHYKYCQDINETQDQYKVHVMTMILDFDSPSTHYYNLEICEKLTHSFRSIIDFLIKKQNAITNSSIIIDNLPTQISTLNWLGSEIEFTELVKALIEAKKLSIKSTTQKEIFIRFRTFFNVPYFKEVDRLSVIKKRTNTYTPLLYELEKSLENWIKKGD